jgi:ABC-type phosphate transport system substrate-binding protein
MTGFHVARSRLARRVSVLVLALGALPATLAAKDVALISNKASSVSTLTQAEVLKVCKGQMDRWPDGKPVTLVMRSPGSPDLKMVEEKIYGLTSDALRELITAANHSRADRPAIIVATSDEDIIRKVESVPGAVGLVDVYSITGAVKVVKIGGKLPLEAGYILHGN